MTRSIVLLSLAVVGLTRSAPAAVEYRLTDLGTLGGTGTWSRAYAINDAGQVVGQSFNAQYTGPFEQNHAFRWDPGAGMTDLGTLGGANSSATGINNSGTVVGWSTTFTDPSLYSPPHAFRMAPTGVMTEVPVFGGSESTSNAINNKGVIIGSATLREDRIFRSFRTDATGAASDIGTNPAVALNDQGQVAGGSSITDVAGRVTEIGTLGGEGTWINAINNRGVAVGRSETGGEFRDDEVYHAFVTDPAGQMTDLGTLGGIFSEAMGLNDQGLVVGEARTRDQFQHAFIYGPGGMRNLDELVPADGGWKLWVASDINNAGQIVGWGLPPDGPVRAFLLTPVPEPSAAGLLGICGLSLLRRRRTTLCTVNHQ